MNIQREDFSEKLIIGAVLIIDFIPAYDLIDKYSSERSTTLYYV